MQIRDKNGRPVEVEVVDLTDGDGKDLVVGAAWYPDTGENLSEPMIQWVEEYYQNQIFEQWFDQSRKHRQTSQTWTGAGKYDA